MEPKRGLDQFRGNSLLVGTLRSQLAKGCVPHSLLFSGLPGLGKATLARFLAKALNCQNASADFCDQCSSCLKINSGTHPDVRLFQPDGQFIKIDSMRTLSRESRYHPFEGRRRVFILEEADRLNLEAANSILKTLEEPPESSVLILVTAKLNDLLPTIRSRCQLYRFVPLSMAEMEQLLASRSELSAQDRKLVSRLSAGSIGTALTLEVPLYKEHRDQLQRLLEACAGTFRYHSAAKVIAGLIDKREIAHFEWRMQILQSLLRDIVLLKTDPASPHLVNVDMADSLAALARSLPLDRLQRAMIVLQNLERGASRNLNKNLALDQFVFELSGEYSGLAENRFG